MRVRWQFYFEYEVLKFEKTYKYVVPVSKERAVAFGLPPQEFEATLSIEADDEKPDRVRQMGKLNIFLPGDNEQTKDLAYSLALGFAEYVTFSQSKIKIDGSFISNELLPETPEEEARVGENRFAWTMHVREVPKKVPFDSASIQRVTNNPLIRQFNEANDAKS